MRKKFLVILSLFIAMILCFTAPAVALADSVVVNPGSGGNVTVIVPTNPGDGTSAIVTVTEDKPVIGDVVSFAEHEWYVIGTDSEGVIAPEGCYTLFAKNNEFGSTAFRSGMSNQDPTIANYKDSDLKKAMENIANGFSSTYKANIVPRATLDGIWGDAVTNQLLWPIAWEEEGVNIATSIREFGSAYWTRNGCRDNPTDVFIQQDPVTGEIIQPPPAPPSYSVPIIEAYGYVQDSYTRGVLCTAEYPGNTHAVRPAAYVKTDAVSKTESKEYKAVVGSQIQFAGYNWYIVGMGDTGPVPGPANTVTLFAASSIKDETGECINSYTDTNYADGELSTVMKGLSDTLGLSAREKALITDRTLTTADGISGNSVTTPFWPLSKDEYEAIYEFDPSFLTDTPGWYYWLRTEYGAYSRIYSVNTKTGDIATIYDKNNSFWVRPACYLDLSDLFFASGESGMRASVGEYPSKLEGPLYGSLQNYNFVMHDDTLSLSMVGAATQRNGSSLTFHYDAVQGEQHYLSYLVERASAPGIPVYYGRAADLSNSGSGTVTVPLTDDGNMRTGIPLVNGDYILRFYTEDRSQGDIIFAGDTVAVGVYVNENKVAISDIKDVNRAAFITGVTITPSSASVENGEQYQFSATVSTDGDEWYDPSVTWSVNGENSYGTYISDTGLLTVGIDETSPTITVTATSVQDNSKRASVTVSIVYVEPKVAILFRDSTTLYKDVESAVAAISGFETTEENRARIILLDNIDLTSTLTFNTGSITLDLNGNMLKQTGSGSVISIGEGADVVLDDWISATTTHNYYVADSGLWTFYDGDLPEAAPEGAETGVVTGGVITGGNATNGGGVSVYGTFTMNGGTISGNEANSSAGYNSGYGGGVYMSGNSTFKMNGGTISGNSANRAGGGVYVDGGTFTINGGTIAGNTAEYGGGVFVKKDGIFTLTSGAISGNTATYYDGGGVFVGGTFTMEGGTISDNTAARMGGGVYISINGTFTMNGGTISGNTVSQEDGGGVYVEGTFILDKGEIAGNYARHGGGVCVSNFATVDFAFTMNGGTISDNTADQGGGVYGYSSGTVLKIDGGTISGNTSDYGGGVYVESSLVMTSGTISENYSNYGSGVYVVSSSTFTLSGGTISGNTAAYDGGGVYMSGNSTFKMNGGTISGNSANRAGGGVYVKGGTVSISGGYLDGTIGGSTVSISGGYFSEAPDAAFIADNHTSQDISVLGGALFDSDYIEGFPYAVYKLGEEFTASASDTVIYDGSPVEEGVDFTVTGAEGVEFVYAYSSDGGALIAGLPTDAGEYTVYAYALNGEKQLLYAKSDITVAKAAYDMSSCVSFKGATVTYDGEAHSLAISGDLPTGVTVTYEGNGKVNAGEYTVKAKFAVSDANYTIDDMTAVLTIDKAMPVYTMPENLTICVEHTLADVTLPVGWAWEDGTLSVDGAGEKQFKAIFTPEDTSNYNTVEESVTVTVMAHTGGTATCTDKAVCSVCGMKYGELAEHTAVEIPAVEATCTQSGMTAGSKCSVCGEILVAPEEIAPLGHVDENGDELCDRCGFDMSIPEFTITVTGGTIEGAIGSTVIVEENGSVTVVASEAPEGKEFKGWSIDGGETIISAEAAYTFTASEDTVLTAVFADKQSDVKPGGEITPENPEGLSGGAIAGIVIGSVLGALIIAYGVCALLYKKKIVKGAFFAKIYPFIKD